MAETQVRLISRATGWSRSSVYHEAASAAQEGRLRCALRWAPHGDRRLRAMLRREGWAVNGTRVRRLMAEVKLQGKVPVLRPRTTVSRHDFPRSPNSVQGLEVTRPDHVWFVDI